MSEGDYGTQLPCKYKVFLWRTWLPNFSFSVLREYHWGGTKCGWVCQCQPKNHKAYGDCCGGIAWPCQPMEVLGELARSALKDTSKKYVSPSKRVKNAKAAAAPKVPLRMMLHVRGTLSTSVDSVFVCNEFRLAPARRQTLAMNQQSLQFKSKQKQKPSVTQQTLVINSQY